MLEDFCGNRRNNLCYVHMQLHGMQQTIHNVILGDILDLVLAYEPIETFLNYFYILVALLIKTYNMPKIFSPLILSGDPWGSQIS